MGDDDFNRAFEYVVQNEGYYVNNPFDRGGPTKYGITLSTLSAWRGTIITDQDVQALTRDEAMAIYQRRYWEPLSCEFMLDLVIATSIFDSSVLFGMSAAVLTAQEALELTNQALRVDGVMGPETLGALNATTARNFIPRYVAALKLRVAKICAGAPKQLMFKNGWNSRVEKLLTLIA